MPTNRSTHLRKLLNRTTTVVAALSLTAFGGVAWAGGAGRSAQPVSTTIANGESGSAIATCPEGTRAISGGFTAPDFSAGGQGGTATVRYSSMRSLKKDWRIDAAGFGGDKPSGQITAHAYCQKPPLKVRIAKAETVVQGQNVGSVTAMCRPKEQAISGGFLSPDFSLKGGEHALALSSYRADRRSWKVDAINVNFDSPDPSKPSRLVGYAFCRKGGPKVTTASTDAVIQPDARGGTDVDASCPAGSKAISGGFDGHITLSQNGLTAAGPVGSVRLDRATGWRTTAVSVAETPALLTSYAYCQATKKK